MSRKPKSVDSYIKNTVWPLFSRYIRLRDCLRTSRTTTHGCCISCGRIKPFDELQAGHWQSRRHKSTLFDEKNVHAQCIYCNKHCSGAQSEHERAMVDLYGRKAVDNIRYKAHNELKKFTIEELQKMAAKYAKKINDLTRGIV